MMSFEEKIASRPGTPTTREEFNAWLEWYSNPDNRYAWDFDLSFEMNGHTVSTNSGLFGHIVVDRVVQDVRDNFCTVIRDNIHYKPTEYIKMKIFG